MARRARGKKVQALVGSGLVTGVAVAICGILLASFALRQVQLHGKRLPQAATVRVEVLNGSGRDGMARRAAQVLRRIGFDVVEIGDAERDDFERTVVVERRSGDLRHARMLARAIGCPRVVQDVDSLKYLEVTVILGRDCDEFFSE
jgi:hypothetical protein